MIAVCSEVLRLNGIGEAPEPSDVAKRGVNCMAAWPFKTGEAQPAAKREHTTDGSTCWCNPELDYKDPDTNAEVWIHKEPQ